MAKITDPKIRVLIGRKLALARENAELKQDEVAINLFGLEQKNRISEIENGRTLPDAELLMTMCKLYGVSADWILGFKIEPELDETASIAGILINSVGDTVFEQVYSITAQISMLYAQHIKSLPKTDVVKLIEAAKTVTQVYFQLDTKAQSVIKPAMMELMECIRQYDRKLANQFNNLTRELDHINQREENELQQKLIIDMVGKRKQRYLQVGLNKNLDIAPQADLFATE